MISDDGILDRLLDWSWAIVLGVFGLLIWVFKWLFGHVSRSSDVASRLSAFDLRIALLEQRWVMIETKLTDLNDRRREDRLEILARIDKHNEIIYKKLDELGKSMAK